MYLSLIQDRRPTCTNLMEDFQGVSAATVNKLYMKSSCSLIGAAGGCMLQCAHTGPGPFAPRGERVGKAVGGVFVPAHRPHLSCLLNSVLRPHQSHVGSTSSDYIENSLLQQQQQQSRMCYLTWQEGFSGTFRCVCSPLCSSSLQVALKITTAAEAPT